MSNIAYVRVSSVGQSYERQIRIIEERAEIDEWFIEKVSGKNTDRLELQNMLKYIRKDDFLYIESFSRLSRSLKDLLELIDEFKSKEVTLISLKENLDSSSASGMLLIKMIGAINEFERENLKERQAEGIKIAKEQGRYKGRKRIEITNEIREYYIKWKAREITQKEIIKVVNMSRTSLYNKFKEIEEEIQKKNSSM